MKENKMQMVTFLMALSLSLFVSLETSAAQSQREIARELERVKLNILKSNIRRIQGDFWDHAFYCEEALFTEIADKRYCVLRVIYHLNSVLTASAYDGFFTAVVSEERLPFYLIGWSYGRELPQEVRFPSRLDWSIYMMNGGDYIGEFENPDILLEVVRGRMQSVFLSSLLR